MKFKISIFYSWLVRSITYFLPNLPIFMRFRGRLYSLMMKKCGKNFQVFSTVYINSLSGLEIEDNVYLAHNISIIGPNIFIGNNVLIGPNTVISGGNHQFDGYSFRDLPSISKPVFISQNSWISANCTITAGSVLPESSLLAAGSVLTCKHQEKYTLYAGSPARSIKKIGDMS